MRNLWLELCRLGKVHAAEREVLRHNVGNVMSDLMRHCNSQGAERTEHTYRTCVLCHDMHSRHHHSMQPQR